MTTIPCEICGKATSFTGTKRCNNCWEVEGRLPDYLQSTKGRDFVERLPDGRALQVLRDLSSIRNLSDFVYDIRDRECLD